MFARNALQPLWMASVVLAALGCGAGSDAGSGGGAGFTAKVEGKPWAAEPIGVTALGAGVPGGLVITGSQVVGGMVQGLTISLTSISVPGTYALGVGVGTYGGRASVGESATGTGASNLWSTRLDGVSGTITITALSPARIVATFQYTTEADAKTMATGTRTVTDGKIDLPIKGVLVPVPDKVGGKLSATIGGKPYNAYSLSGRLQDYTGGAGVSIDSHSSENKINLMLVGVTAPGSWPLSNVAPQQRTITAGLNGGDASHCCWGVNAGGDTGTITVTSLTPTRVKGTFSGTLQPQPGKPATTPLVITDGVFDVGID